MQEKAKPVARQERKAMGLKKTAGLPEKARSIVADSSGSRGDSAFSMSA